MTLIETRSSVFGVEIPPVLCERTAVERRAAECRRVIDRRRQRVLDRRRQPSAEPSTDLELRGIPNRVAAGCQVTKASGTARARILAAGRIGIREDFLHQVD